MSAKDISARQQNLTVDARSTRRKAERPARTRDGAHQINRVARAHRTLKAHLIEARIERRRAARLLIAHQQHAAVLGEHLALNHAGDDRVSRKMPLQKVLVARDRDLAVGLVAHQLGLVEQKHRLAMR